MYDIVATTLPPVQWETSPNHKRRQRRKYIHQFGLRWLLCLDFGFKRVLISCKTHLLTDPTTQHKGGHEEPQDPQHAYPPFGKVNYSFQSHTVLLHSAANKQTGKQYAKTSKEGSCKSSERIDFKPPSLRCLNLNVIHILTLQQFVPTCQNDVFTIYNYCWKRKENQSKNRPVNKFIGLRSSS